MHFGENQLSRSLIGLSPLPTTHPLSLQPKWVRASTNSCRCYPPRVNLATCSWSAGSIFKRPAITPRFNTKALTDCKRTVSGTLSLPSRGTFHHSLTVLIRYRSLGSIQPYQVVLADSRQITGVRRYSGTPTTGHELSPTGLSPSTVPHSRGFD